MYIATRGRDGIPEAAAALLISKRRTEQRAENRGNLRFVPQGSFGPVGRGMAVSRVALPPSLDKHQLGAHKRSPLPIREATTESMQEGPRRAPSAQYGLGEQKLSECHLGQHHNSEWVVWLHSSHSNNFWKHSSLRL